MRKIYYNGDLITMDDAHPFASAIGIEDGKIFVVGSDDEVLKHKDENTELVDLAGQVMMPAFIDSHSHFIGVANSLSECDLTEATSFDDIVSYLKKFIEDNHIPEGAWVGGRNYDPNFLAEQKHPTKEVLDQVSTKHKIVITHVSNHMGCINSLALADKNITASTPDPRGGRIDRVPGSMEPSGFLEENAFMETVHGSAMPAMDVLMENVQKAQEVYASYGITTCQDAMVTEPLYAMLDSLAKDKKLYLDVVGYVDIQHGQHHFHDDNPYINQYHNHFKLGGYKIFLDGSPQGCTAWNTFPYVGQGDFCGYPIYDDETVEKYIRIAMKDQQQFQCHANGDRAAEQFISLFEKVQKEDHLTNLYHPILTHCQFTRKDQFERMPALGMIPTIFVAHVYYWGDVHIKNIGLERGSLISSVKTALDLGLPYTLHQDTPVVPCDMMKTVWCAVNRISRAGTLVGPEQRIGVYDALKGITIHGANQYGEADIKGSLTAGKQANMILLSDNPLKVDPMKLDTITVLETIHQGKTVFKRS